MEDRLYSLEELSQILKITRRTLYTWIKDGKLNTIKVGREHRVTAEELHRITSGGLQ